MENKYYTPEIEEFYIGFEYCVDQFPNSNLPCLNRWLSLTNYSINLEGVAKGIHEGRIRVKYLDLEDVSSLGIERQGEVCILKVTETQRYEFYISDKTLYIHYTQDDGDMKWGHYAFVGTVKNKSEFKKLLQMLGIDYNKPDNQG